MSPRGCVRYHMMHKVSHLILLWTRQSVVASGYMSLFET